MAHQGRYRAPGVDCIDCCIVGAVLVHRDLVRIAVSSIALLADSAVAILADALDLDVRLIHMRDAPDLVGVPAVRRVGCTPAMWTRITSIGNRVPLKLSMSSYPGLGTAVHPTGSPGFANSTGPFIRREYKKPRSIDDCFIKQTYQHRFYSRCIFHDYSFRESHLWNGL